jgi:hypothetical protein
MALFLNTQKLNHWIPILIGQAKTELILIVPYIQTSENIFNSLQTADNNGIEIILVYRENKLSKLEKEKLLSLTNISLLHHPNIHCKCYFNGDLLILGSMNLYEYSEKNNREMGVLFFNSDLNYDDEYNQLLSDPFESFDEDKIFTDAIYEIREIVNSSSLEKASERAKSNSFDFTIIKSDEELELERCKKFNQYFLNKKFKIFEESEGVWFSKCNNYFDNVDVVVEDRRFAVKFNLSEIKLRNIFSEWHKTYDEFEFKGFKYYWNDYDSNVLMYRDRNYDWDTLKENDILYYKKIKEGIDLIVNKYRIIIGK